MSWRNSENRTITRAHNPGFRGRGRAPTFSQGRGSSTGNTGNRRLENIASVSRSSGVQIDGDALKDYATQEEYREFIQGKLDTFWKRPTHTEQQSRDIQENLLILFRKLREGIVASKRNDAFAIEVCETSLYLATMFDNPRHLNSILPYFISQPSEATARVLTQQTYSVCAIFIALIGQLILGYPSQTLYRQSIHSIPNSLLQRSSKAYRWISSLSSSIWTNSFSKFEKLTRQSSLSELLDELSPNSLSTEFNVLSLSSQPTKSNFELAGKAFCHVVNTLRTRVRHSTWNIIRSSYRELSCSVDSETRDWLIRSLALDVVRLEDAFDSALDTWLKEKSAAGHIRPKDGVDGRWIVCRS
ncbi:hypothetical protein J3R30DRAFT_2158429 [Lentinula aciculospora]|uniref:Uncharacterized protein n=1 Tax=Lentinula aciculospora TaxID=153920 RepID=A0A9W9AI30_9AGAR|nr:hypothetical protein J3R30DRAFT_2158429 [Lentinula aciculospora]